jgi:hypothetical protein
MAIGPNRKLNKQKIDQRVGEGTGLPNGKLTKQPVDHMARKQSNRLTKK